MTPIQKTLFPEKANEPTMQREPARDLPETKKAIEQSYRRAKVEWKQIANRAVFYLAKTSRQFTSADIDLAMMKHYPEQKTYDKRALGHVLRAAAGEGYITRTEQFIPDPRPNCHQNPIRVWKSLIYEGKV